MSSGTSDDCRRAASRDAARVAGGGRRHAVLRRPPAEICALKGALRRLAGVRPCWRTGNTRGEGGCHDSTHQDRRGERVDDLIAVLAVVRLPSSCSSSELSPCTPPFRDWGRTSCTCRLTWTKRFGGFAIRGGPRHRLRSRSWASAPLPASATRSRTRSCGRRRCRRGFPSADSRRSTPNVDRCRTFRPGPGRGNRSAAAPRLPARRVAMPALRNPDPHGVSGS